MRKALAVMIALGLVVGSLAAPATAGKKKKKGTKVNESFTAQGLPLPNLSSSTGTEYRSCFAGEEGIHKTSQTFEAPGKGRITATMHDFTGDWDLAIADETGRPIIYSVEDQTAGAPAHEEAYMDLSKGDVVQIVACNFAGAPEAEVTYEGLFK